MKLRLSDVPPDTTDPFKDDLLDRKEFARRLVAFLANVEGPFTMAITGPYGSGKSFFLRRCKALFEELKVPVALINAWETDFSPHPIA
jgi:pantothenate kinase-related protein Tda10